MPSVIWDEERLPADLLALASRRGNEWAWSMQHVPTVITVARDLGLATLGGQIQFRCPEGTYELYWLDSNASARAAGETWERYVTRSAEEVLAGFQRLPASIEDLLPEIMSWPALATHHRAGVDLAPFLCFVLSFAQADNPAVADPGYPAT